MLLTLTTFVVVIVDFDVFCVSAGVRPEDGGVYIDDMTPHRERADIPVSRWLISILVIGTDPVY